MSSAEHALEDLADELGTNLLFEDRGIFEGDTPQNSYDDYIDEVDEQTGSMSEGKNTLLLYNRYFKNEGSDGGGGSDAWPNLGASRHMYRTSEKAISIANANIKMSPSAISVLLPGLGAITSSRADRFFRNMVKHEVLHTMLESDWSVNNETDHSNGSQVRHWFEPRVTPMMSGYGELGTPNNRPLSICKDDGKWATNWKSSISACTANRAKIWLDDYYGDGDDDDSGGGNPPPDCPYVQCPVP